MFAADCGVGELFVTDELRLLLAGEELTTDAVLEATDTVFDEGALEVESGLTTEVVTVLEPGVVTGSLAVPLTSAVALNELKTA